MRNMLDNVLNEVKDEKLERSTGGAGAHSTCFRCGWVATQEMERCYSKKWRAELGGDDKWHDFCLSCVRELGLDKI